MEENRQLVLKTYCVHYLNHFGDSDQFIYLAYPGEPDDPAEISIFKEQVEGQDRDKIQYEPPRQVLRRYLL